MCGMDLATRLERDKPSRTTENQRLMMFDQRYTKMNRAAFNAGAVISQNGFQAQ